MEETGADVDVTGAGPKWKELVLIWMQPEPGRSGRNWLCKGKGNILHYYSWIGRCTMNLHSDSISLASVLAIFLVYMLVCAWKSGKQGYKFIGEDNPTCNTRFLNYFATPIFALLIASAWFMTSTLLAADTTSVDLCYDETLTGETVLRMLNQKGYASTSEAYLNVDEYLRVSRPCINALIFFMKERTVLKSNVLCVFDRVASIKI